MILGQIAKRLGALSLAGALLLSLASCGNTPEIPLDPSTEQSSVTNFGLIKEEKIYEGEADGSGVTEFPITMEGNFSQLSEKATTSIERVSSANASFDTEDGFVMVSSESLDGGTILQFLKIDPATGKQIERLRYTLPTIPDGYVEYIERLTNVAEYGENFIAVSTKFGLYIFDLRDLNVDPVIISVKNFAFPSIVFETSDGSIYQWIYGTKDIDLSNKKLTYLTEEGLYIAQMNGEGSEQLIPQPENKDWFSGEVFEGFEMPETQKAIYVEPRFFAGGTKIAMGILCWENPEIEYVGIAIYDIATGEVTEHLYYGENSIIAGLAPVEAGEYQMYAAYRPMKKDDNTLTFLTTGVGTLHSKSTSLRLDVFIDVTAGETSGKLSFTGFTTDFETLAINDNYKGAAGKATFFDMNTSEYLEKGVVVTDAAMPVPVAISSKYCIFKVSVIGEDDTFVFIIVPIEK